ncbi:LysR family transcriptional regulator [Reinekea sp.]|jgi:DNA-binding transcriptional LysR family regulator|uniref:LysR family transcriptional regulator n=1 Tax=Reinekea sp. TaxID=1970455 RepID=UPI002A83711E|nr:LysR family transcriptional regulator [Reinekea sp.]
MDHLSEIQAFLAIADLGNFTKAAEHLGLSRSRISQLITRLEDRLGVMLMHRTTRSLTLTPEGEQFRSGCRQGIAHLEQAEASLRLMSTRLSGPVRINSVGGVFGETFLSKALAEVLSEHPELTVHLNYSSNLIDLNRDPVDLVLRIGKEPGHQVASAHLGEIQHVLCASPKFVNLNGFPQNPKDLEQFRTITGTPKTWELTRGHEVQVVTPKSCWHSPSSLAQRIASEQGLGIARLLTAVAQESLVAGRLLRVLPDWQIEPTQLWLLWSNQGDLPKRIEMVRDHLRLRLINLISDSRWDLLG